MEWNNCLLTLSFSNNFFVKKKFFLVKSERLGFIETFYDNISLKEIVLVVLCDGFTWHQRDVMIKNNIKILLHILFI